MKKANLVITVATAAAIGLGGLALAQQRDHAPRGAGGPDMGAMLMEGLQKTPGCLGVDAGQFRSGKNAIIAWFEDKAAVKRWFYSPVHQRMMQGAMGADAPGPDHEPLRHVADGVPIMVMASITFTDEPQVEGIRLPISQIAIEIYSAQPGGAHVNGRLAPDSFKVAHMKAYTPPAAAGE